MEYLTIKGSQPKRKPKQKNNDTRQEFLRSFFKGNQNIVNVNGFVLVLQNHAYGKLVAIYSKDSYEKYEQIKRLEKELAEQGHHIASIKNEKHSN